MENIQQLIAQVEAFAAQHGMRPDLVCRKASGNPRLLDRLHRRAAQTEMDIARLLAFMNSKADTAERAPSQAAPQGNASGTKRNDRVKRQQPKSEGTP